MPTYIPPAGLTPAGSFVPTLHVLPNEPVGILADPIDPATGEYLSLERGFDPTDAAVLTALSIIRGTGAAVLSTGQRFRDVTHQTPDMPAQLKAEAQLALSHLVQDGQIRISRIEVISGDDWAELHIRYVNLARGQDRLAVLPLTTQARRVAA